jgi:preprotein translocase SecE subunit
LIEEFRISGVPKGAVEVRNSKVFVKASSSIGRASVSKTEGWGFETLLACQVSCKGQGSTGRSVIQFGRESVQETKKVVWPTRKESIQTTGVVFALVVVMAIFLWVVDVSVFTLVKMLLGRGD